MRDEVDLVGKRPDGAFAIPASAHVRAAHPSLVGSGRMLRRSYNFTESAGPDEAGGGSLLHNKGILFTAFQRDIKTFVLTQQRMDDVDALTAFLTPTATAAFAILPGFTVSSRLGSTLR